MSHYLITGGQGFIGSKIVSEIKGTSFDIKSGATILNQTQFEGAVKGMQGMYHCAAKISVPESILKPDEYYQTNVKGTEIVTNVATEFGIKIVFSSSAAVYGEANKIVNEESMLIPKSPYAQNKIDGENLLRTSKVPHIALRYFNVYGPGQSAQYAGVITSFICNALQGKDLSIYGDGSQVRDFVFITDIVRANIKAMEYKNENFEIFNIGSGIETTIQALAEMILRLTNSTSKIVHEPLREGDIVYSRADVSKAKKLLDWQSEVTLEDGLRETISYYKNQSFI